MTACILSRIDIVDFSEIYPEKQQCINNILDYIHQKIYDEISGINEALETNYHITLHQIYGDTLDIYFEDSDQNSNMLLNLIKITAEIQNLLLENNLLVRGAIVKGDLFSDKHKFTGTAMVKAHNEELNLSGPFIALSNEIVALLKRSIQNQILSVDDSESCFDSLIFNKKCLNYTFNPPYLNCILDYDFGNHSKNIVKTICQYQNRLRPNDKKYEKCINMYESLIKFHNLQCSEQKIRYSKNEKGPIKFEIPSDKNSLEKGD